MAEVTSAATIPRASPFAMLAGETPQDAAARLALPCELVQTRHGCVIVLGQLSEAQKLATYRHIRRTMRAREPLAAPAPVPEAVSA